MLKNVKHLLFSLPCNATYSACAFDNLTSFVGETVYNGSTVAEKWTKLRDSYYQAKKRLKTKSGDGASKKPTWYLFHQFSWLDDFMTGKKNKT